MHEPLLANTNRPQLLESTAPIIHVLHRDYEARSRVLLRLVGTHRFAAEPSSEPLCCAFAVDDGPVQLWTPGDPVPPEFVEAANIPDWVVAAHGDHFESALEHHIMFSDTSTRPRRTE
jgi:DNA polymerase